MKGGFPPQGVRRGKGKSPTPPPLPSHLPRNKHIKLGDKWRHGNQCRAAKSLRQIRANYQAINTPANILRCWDHSGDWYIECIIIWLNIMSEWRHKYHSSELECDWWLVIHRHHAWLLAFFNVCKYLAAIDAHFIQHEQCCRYIIMIALLSLLLSSSPFLMFPLLFMHVMFLNSRNV